MSYTILLTKLLEKIKMELNYLLQKISANEITEKQMSELARLVEDHNKKLISLFNFYHLLKKQISYGLDDLYDRFYLIKKTLKPKDSSSYLGCIMRYGEKAGKELFELKNKKCVQTLENFISRHGEKEGTIRYKSYSKSRSMSLENCQRRYGEIAGEKAFRDYWDNTGFGSSLKHAKIRYGEIDYIEKYDTLCKKGGHSRTEIGFMERYGAVEGEKMYLEYNNKRGESCNKKTHILKCIDAGLDEKEILESIDKRWNQTSLSAFIRRLGEELGTEEYYKFTEKIKKSNPLRVEYYLTRKIPELLANEIITDIIIERNLLIKTCSKESLKFLIPIADLFFIDFDIKEENIYVGNKYRDQEYYLSLDHELREKTKRRIFFYDLTILDFNLIIEYHGIRFHRDLDYDSTIKATLEDVIEEVDLLKKWYAEQRGFTVLILRSWKLNEDLTKIFNYINDIRCIEKWKPYFMMK